MVTTQSTRRRPLYLLAATLLTVAAAACGGDDSTGPGPDITPTATVGTVTIVNSAQSGSVLFLLRRACGTTTWSADMLGAGLLFGGDQQSWQLDAGCYEFRLTPAEVGLDYLYFNGVQLDAGETETLTITEFPLEP